MVNTPSESISVKELDVREIYSMLVRIEQKLGDLDRYLHDKLEYLDRRITAATARR
ncbi:MAG: hypothetical protein J7J94_03515 [Thaumarchaeota archaeon]|nr:hypothetical protein [Nitrososphaerota archaeon]